ncbi:MAG: hypothetical protein WD276_03195 [Actinomycetota bacterium]
MRVIRKFLLVALVSSALLAVHAPRHPAQATFPGTNGKIAYTSFFDGRPQIYTTHPNLMGKTRLTNPPPINFAPSWNRFADRIYFATGPPNGTSNIYSMDPDGHLRTQITNAQPRSYVDPAISPDGTKIVAVGIRTNGGQDLYLMNANGTGVTQLTDTAALESDPSFSPVDGLSVTFARETLRGRGFIMTQGVSGSPTKRLTPKDGNAYEPSYDPTQTMIAYSKETGNHGETQRIFRINTNGTGNTKVTDTPAGEIWFAPSWSPDGLRIAAIKLGEGSRVNRIVAMDVDGANRVRVTPDTVDPIDTDWGVG